MMHRLFKSHNLMNIFFAVLMSIPLISIGVRCAYVVINKNAYQSYSGTTTYSINYKYTNGNLNNFNNTDIYHFRFDSESIETNQPQLSEYNISVVKFNYFYIDNSQSTDVIDMYMPYTYIDTLPYVHLVFNGVNLDLMYGNPSYDVYFETEFYTDTYTLDFIGIILDDPVTNIYNNLAQDNILSITDYNEILSVDIDNTGTLDNVFEYSINQFISSNEIGNLNFFTWFNGVFFTNNAQASTYINFINWYLNYMILVSCGYILFLMLMWFVNFVRKLLDRSMNIYDK